jgi:DNA-binding NtrC family response regulator/tetratricopeptide (TPR) repeat protein
MDSVSLARQLSSVGKYRAALEALPKEGDRREAASTQLLRAELLALIGDCAKAQKIVENVNAQRGLSDLDRSHLEFVLYWIALESGSREDELQYLQKSIFYADRAGDLYRACWAQYSLGARLADLSGPDAIGGLIAGFRTNATKLGDATITAALHVLVGLIDGKRGLLETAVQHTHLALRLLKSAPHLWIETICHTNLAVISIVRCDLDQALLHGEAALETSNECGALRWIRASLSNLGHIYLTMGRFDIALEHFQRVLSLSEYLNENVFIARESIAQTYLAQGKPEDSLSFVGFPDDPAHGIGGHSHRYAQLTKAKILARLGRWQESLQLVERAIALAEAAGDRPLATTASMFLAEVLLHCGRTSESWIFMTEASPLLVGRPPDMSARYERAIACALAANGDFTAARLHRDRAERILECIQNRPEFVDLRYSWEQAQKLASGVSESGSPSAAAGLLQNVATLLLHAGRPMLLATGIVVILKDADCASGAVAVARDEHGVCEELAAFGTIEPDAKTRTLPLGSARNRTIEVRVAPLPDIESQATVNAVTILLGTIHDLERAQVEREERLTLWPIDEPPYEGDDSVIAGRMRDLMSSARKVARTNVTVLLTGESGTGKEVLARAIHGFSARAKRPFVPFNCTAIPRELLESQLFGFRRGAFTGAERDNPGLIRAAKDGTLFLDEVGELGLDLQPKLLRFLESGEINPLGETSPFNVDVRIVAATNANLERLVEEGRFREDLFYRLNVICLTIPPLRERRDEIPGLVHHFVAKAAGEFGKGRVRVAEETMERLVLYAWPGNVRQLQNELRRMVALADVDSTLTPSTLSKIIRQETMRAIAHGNGSELAVSLTEQLTPALTRIEREMIKAALRANQGRLEATAKALGISRKGLYLKRQRLGV